MTTQRNYSLETLGELKRAGGKFCMLTCYDATTAKLAEAVGIDTLLVGDTAGEVILGYASTRDIQPDILIELTAAVRRGAPATFILGDLPWGCRQGDTAETVRWTQRFMTDAGCDAVKVEVTREDLDLVRAMVEADLPIVAHLGLLPQRVDPAKGYRARGREADDALELIEAARQFEAVGAKGLLLEAVASEVVAEITQSTSLPVIGCAAGPHCDGTVVVLHDMLGWGGGHPPRAVKQYVNLADVMTEAFQAFADDVRSGKFPAEQHTIHMKPNQLDKLHARTKPK